MKKVLVTGGAGYIGSHTVVELLDAGHEVVVVDNYYNSKPEVLNRIREITGKNVKFYEVDILDRKALDEVFAKEEIESVIHFAAYKAVGESVEKPIDYYYNNITGLLTLTEIMKKHDVKNIVFSSSATVYGLNNISPLREDMPTSATNPYGRTKLMAEEILRDIHISDNSWNVALLRYFNPIGAHESGRIGENPNGIPNNLMPYITQVAVGKREKLSVFGSDYDTHDGTGVRDYIHVVDLAVGHIKALNKLKEGIGCEAYNLGTGNGYSVLDLVKAFEEASGVEIRYELTERRAGDVATCFADAGRAERELGWTAERGIADMCRDSWNWQRNNPEGY